MSTTVEEISHMGKKQLKQKMAETNAALLSLEERFDKLLATLNVGLDDSKPVVIGTAHTEETADFDYCLPATPTEEVDLHDEVANYLQRSGFLDYHGLEAQSVIQLSTRLRELRSAIAERDSATIITAKSRGYELGLKDALRIMLGQEKNGWK